MTRILLAVLAASFSLAACAETGPTASTEAPASLAASAGTGVQPAAGTPEARAVEVVRGLNPRAEVVEVGPSPIEGFTEAVVGGQVLYISNDGRYLLLMGQDGALLDLEASRDLSEVTRARARTDLLARIPQSERIVFAPADPEYTVTVFTDIECGFCRRMHGQIDEYNAQGIAVEYLAFPRMGPGSPGFEEMVAVWCAPDRKQALTRAKAAGTFKGKSDCKNTVRMQYDIGHKAGLTGTPMVLAADGTRLGGYLPPAQLRARLDELSAR